MCKIKRLLTVLSFLAVCLGLWNCDTTDVADPWADNLPPPVFTLQALDGAVQVDFTNESGQDYKLYYGTLPRAITPYIDGMTVSSSPFILSNLSNSVPYYLAMITTEGENYSGYAAEKTAIPTDIYSDTFLYSDGSFSNTPLNQIWRHLGTNQGCFPGVQDNTVRPAAGDDVPDGTEEIFRIPLFNTNFIATNSFKVSC
ncbi:MAG TPA: hypothetical protein VKS21_05720, partial [Spirochaetota bacterium]|nr:hypothetical protein [Spirochaetota bacterium]